MRILYEQSQNGGTVLDLLGIQNLFAGNMTHKWKTCAANSKLHSHAIYEIHILQNSDMSLRRISERMNFASGSYFSRFFKQHTGMTPGEYRNKMGTA